MMTAGFVACRDNAIVERMSSEMPGLVETSNNLAMVKIEGGEFSPDERANIPSVAKCWEFLQTVLENIPVK